MKGDKKRLIHLHIKNILHMRRAGMSYKSIANFLGVSESFLYQTHTGYYPPNSYTGIPKSLYNLRKKYK